MPRLNDKYFAIARVYARSMLQLAEEAGTTDELLAELRGLAAYTEESPEFRDFLASPLIKSEDRRQALEDIFRGRTSDLLVDSLQVLNRKGRLGLLPVVAEGFRREVRDLRGFTDVHITTAVPLSAELRERLRKVVHSLTGRTADLVEKVNPDLLGGLVVRIGDRKTDTSVARELERLSGALQARTSREILSGKDYTAESDAG